MDEHNLSKFYFDGYIINNIEFDFNSQFDNEGDILELDFNLDYSVKIDEEENHKGSTQLRIKIWEDAYNNNYPFKLSVEIIGFFSADKEMDKKKFAEMCESNGTAILFPFLRSVITDITKNANVTPLVMPLINVENFIKDKNNS
ncbi:protein-export chaperone SecB [Natronospora cellulosivora (SeqCode)]